MPGEIAITIPTPFCQRQVDFAEKRFPLRTMMVHAGHQKINTIRYRWNGLARGDWELAIWQYTLRGRGKLQYEDKTLDVLPGQAMLLRVPEAHCYYYPADATEDWEFFYLGMNGRELLRVWREIQSRIGPLAAFSPESETIRQAVDLYEKVVHQALETPFQASAVTYAFLMALVEEILPRTEGPSPEPPFVRKVVDFCAKNLSRPISVDDMARAAGYSRFHFSRRFAAAKGQSPAAFLNDLRMKRAARLLRTGTQSVKEIADACGFSDPSYFCKVFRAAYGRGPARFRTGGGAIPEQNDD